jgi:hypothetical protein
MSANDPKRTSGAGQLVFLKVAGRITIALHSMRTSIRRLVSWVAIYAVALHAILLGVAPALAGGAAAGDPFAIICHSDAQGAASGEQAPGRPDVPGHACDHCILCSASAPPVLVSVFAGQLVPLRLLQVLQPASTAARSHPAITPHLARGPPNFA